MVSEFLLSQQLAIDENKFKKEEDKKNVRMFTYKPSRLKLKETTMDTR